MAGYVITNPRTGTEFFIDTTYAWDTEYHSGKRRDPKSRKYIVVHHTAGSTAGDLKVLRGDTDRRASVKYLVPDPQEGNFTDGSGRFIIYELLPNDVIGWSIGTSTGTYAYVTNGNSDSIEVSNRGDGSDPFESVQVEAVEALIAYEEHRLSQELDVFAHYQTSPGRKVDPYRTFPMQRVDDFAEWHTLVTQPAPAQDVYYWLITHVDPATARAELARMQSAGKAVRLHRTTKDTHTQINTLADSLP